MRMPGHTIPQLMPRYVENQTNSGSRCGVVSLYYSLGYTYMVGTTGFEPATSSVSRKRSNQLSYAPAWRLELDLGEPITIQASTDGTKPNNQLSSSLSGSQSDANASPAAVAVRSLINDDLDRSPHCRDGRKQ